MTLFRLLIAATLFTACFHVDDDESMEPTSEEPSGAGVCEPCTGDSACDSGLTCERFDFDQSGPLPAATPLLCAHAAKATGCCRRYQEGNVQHEQCNFQYP